MQEGAIGYQESLQSNSCHPRNDAKKVGTKKTHIFDNHKGKWFFLCFFLRDGTIFHYISFYIYILCPNIYHYIYIYIIIYSIIYPYYYIYKYIIAVIYHYIHYIYIPYIPIIPSYIPYDVPILHILCPIKTLLKS